MKDFYRFGKIHLSFQILYFISSVDFSFIFHLSFAVLFYDVYKVLLRSAVSFLY